MKDGIVEDIRVLRGAPCGATWTAAEKVKGMPIEDALIRIGLETQFECVADPAGWDPIYGKSPVHFAGYIHQAALRRAAGLPPNPDAEKGIPRESLEDYGNSADSPEGAPEDPSHSGE